jgi:hypothetical protein
VTQALADSALKRTLDLVQSVPANEPVALLIRHSTRDDIPDGGTGLDLPLNELGIRLCQELGKAMAGRVKSARASPVLRCVQTAEFLCFTAKAKCEVILDTKLGAPGIYVLDEQMAWQNWLAMGNDGVIRHLIAGSGALAGMADPAEAAYGLIEHLLGCAKVEPGVHVFVSHDSIVAPTVARAFGKDIHRNEWPEYLDAAAFWRSCDGPVVMYRKKLQALIAAP